MEGNPLTRILIKVQALGANILFAQFRQVLQGYLMVFKKLQLFLLYLVQDIF
jgi:hypothetical protein